MTPREQAKARGLRIPTLQQLHTTNTETLEEKIRADLPKMRFHPEKLWIPTNTEGGMRATRITQRGTNSKAVVKWDTTPNSSHGKHTYNKGNITFNDLQTLEDRSHTQAPNSLSRILHASSVEHEGHDIIYLVEEHYEGPTLRETTKNNPLKPKKLIETFTPLLKGVHYHTTTEGIYHRDPHLGNITDSPEGPVLFDWANTKKIDEAQDTIEPTSGKRITADPLLYKNLTGKEKPYDLGSELWSWGINMLRAATGTDPYTLDQNQGTWRTRDGRNLLTLEGTINREAWNAYREELLDTLDPKLEGIKHLIRRLTSLDTKTRYTDTTTLLNDWRRATTKTPWYRTALGQAAILVGLATSIGGSTIAGINQAKIIDLEAALEQERTATPISGGYVDDLEIASNLATDLELAVGWNKVEQLDAQYTNTPDTVRIDLYGVAIPRERDELGTYIGKFPAQVSIEGIDVRHTAWGPDMIWKPRSWNEGGGITHWPVNIPVLNGIMPGTYRIIYDVFPTAEGEEPDWTNVPNITYSNHERALIQKVGSLVVGDIPAEEQIILRDATFDYSDHMVDFAAVHPERNMAKDIYYEYVLVDEPSMKVERAQTSHPAVNVHDINIQLPTLAQYHPSLEPFNPRDSPMWGSPYLASTHNEQLKVYEEKLANIQALEHNPERTLQIIACRDNRILTVAYLPLQQVVDEDADGTPMMRDGEIRRHWELLRPDKGFAERAVAYRVALDKEGNTCHKPEDFR